MKNSAVEVRDDQIAQYRDDGAVVIRGLLDAPMLAEAERAFQWSVDHPSPAAQRYGGGSKDAVFYQDLFNTKSWNEYRRLFTDSSMPDVLARLWGCDDIWFFFEQGFSENGWRDS